MSINQPNSRLPAIIGGTVLFFSVVLILLEIINYSRNTLLENGRWVSSKLLMQVNLMGARHFVLTRNALHENHLNLGEWHAFNEVHFNELFQPKVIQFRFRLDDQAYLNTIFARDDSGYFGVRLSRSARFPSMVFRANHDNEFIMTWPLTETNIGDKWRTLRLEFRDRNLAIILDETRVGVAPVFDIGLQFFGFRSGAAPATVDDVMVIDANDVVVLSENFRKDENYTIAISVAAVALLIAAFAVPFFLTRLKPRRRQAEAVNGIMLTGVVVVVIAATYFVVDFYFWSSRYIYTTYTPGNRQPASVLVSLEAARMSVFGTNYDRYVGTEGSQRTFEFEAFPYIEPHALLRPVITKWTLEEWFPQDAFVAYASTYSEGFKFFHDDEMAVFLSKPESTIRILYIGTSQTVGVGAEVVTETMVSKSHEILEQSMPEGFALESINLARSASRSGPLFRDYSDRGVRFLPDIVVINLSYNDGDPTEFRENLQRFIELNRSRGIETFLVLEPSSEEVHRDAVVRNHGIVRSVGDNGHVQVWDLDAYLNGEGVYDSGFLWWDGIHLTSYGQSLAGRWLANQLRPQLSDVAASRSPVRGIENTRGPR